MKDKKKAEAARLLMYADDAAITKLCVTCHNEKSPHAKKFEIAKAWASIEHTIPKAAK